jgi:hypothetical protein
MKRVSLNKYNKESSKQLGMNMSITNLCGKRRKAHTNNKLKKDLKTEINDENNNKDLNDNDYHKPKVSRNKHISIDCSNNDLTRNSVNYLPIIKTNREKKGIIPIAITSNQENKFFIF